MEQRHDPSASQSSKQKISDPRVDLRAKFISRINEITDDDGFSPHEIQYLTHWIIEKLPEEKIEEKMKKVKDLYSVREEALCGLEYIFNKNRTTIISAIREIRDPKRVLTSEELSEISAGGLPQFLARVFTGARTPPSFLKAFPRLASLRIIDSRFDPIEGVGCYPGNSDKLEIKFKDTIQQVCAWLKAFGIDEKEIRNALKGIPELIREPSSREIVLMQNPAKLTKLLRENLASETPRLRLEARYTDAIHDFYIRGITLEEFESRYKLKTGDGTVVLENLFKKLALALEPYGVTREHLAASLKELRHDAEARLERKEIDPVSILRDANSKFETITTGQIQNYLSSLSTDPFEQFHMIKEIVLPRSVVNRDEEISEFDQFRDCFLNSGLGIYFMVEALNGLHAIAKSESEMRRIVYDYILGRSRIAREAKRKLEILAEANPEQLLKTIKELVEAKKIPSWAFPKSFEKDVEEKFYSVNYTSEPATRSLENLRTPIWSLRIESIDRSRVREYLLRAYDRTLVINGKKDTGDKPKAALSRLNSLNTGCPLELYDSIDAILHCPMTTPEEMGHIQEALQGILGALWNGLWHKAHTVASDVTSHSSH